jgi:hypothetical protein
MYFIDFRTTLTAALINQFADDRFVFKSLEPVG